jgi:peptide/nickel transport system substrate-binding protein
LPEPDGVIFPKFEWFFQIAPAFFAEHEFEPNNWGRLTEAGPWGTGPFILVEGSALYAKPSDQVVLEAYEDYWDPQYPKVKRIIFDNTLIGNREEAMRLCMEKEGAVDIVSHIRPLDTLKVAESPFAKVAKNKDVAALIGWINQRKKDSKWRDIRLRRAMNLAVNREELWKYAAKGNAHNLGGFIPEGAYGHNPNLTLFAYNTTEARSLLAEAGYPEGFEIKIIAPEGYKLESQIISKMLERIDVKVKLEVFTFPEFTRRTVIPILEKPPEEQDWDIAIYCLHDFYGHCGTTFLTWGLIDESDVRWIEYDSVYEKMWKEMALTVNNEEQEEKIRQMVQYIYDRAYYLFIYSPLSLYAVNKEVDFVPHDFSILRLRDTSVTDNHWSIRERDK